MQWFQQHDAAAWLGLAVLLGVAELLSGELVLLMLACGALAAAGTAAISDGVLLPAVMAALVSLATLLLLRPPLVRRLHDGPDLVTGFDALVGTRGTVTAAGSEPGIGQARIGGEIWTIRPADPQDMLPVGTDVEVLGIEGATAVVRRPPAPELYVDDGGPS